MPRISPTSPRISLAITIPATEGREDLGVESAAALSPQGASPLDPTGGRAYRGTVKQSLCVNGTHALAPRGRAHEVTPGGSARSRASSPGEQAAACDFQTLVAFFFFSSFQVPY